MPSDFDPSKMQMSQEFVNGWKEMEDDWPLQAAQDLHDELEKVPSPPLYVQHIHHLYDNPDEYPFAYTDQQGACPKILSII